MHRVNLKERETEQIGIANWIKPNKFNLNSQCHCIKLIKALIK